VTRRALLYSGIAPYLSHHGEVDILLRVSEKAIRFDACSTTMQLVDNREVEQTWRTTGKARSTSNAGEYISGSSRWQRDDQKGTSTVLQLVVERIKANRFCIVFGSWEDSDGEYYDFAGQFELEGECDDEELINSPLYLGPVKSRARTLKSTGAAKARVVPRSGRAWALQPAAIGHVSITRARIVGAVTIGILLVLIIAVARLFRA
jgi:hypothetical protein